MKVLFLGSPKFARNVLDKIVQSRHDVVAVVCQPDKPSGRGHRLISPEVKVYAQEKGIEVLQYDKVSQHIDEVFSRDIDVVVVASFGQILSREFLGKKLALNVHPSKLPKYRGATPLQTALLNGDTQTSVTIQKMEYEVDSGDVLISQDVIIDREDNFETLSKKTAEIGGSLIVNSLDLIESGEAVFKKQEGEVTYTQKIEKEDGFINFEKSAESIFNKVRALSCNPGCYFNLGEDRIKVAEVEVVDGHGEIGEILSKNKQFVIMAKDRGVKILKCQAPGGKMLDAKDFLNGYKFKVNKV